MTNELDNKLEKLKKYSKEKKIKNLQKRIYDLNLSDEYLNGLNQGLLQFIHVKLHNALSFKKPFANIKEIKKVHNRLVKHLKTHSLIDELDA